MIRIRGSSNTEQKTQFACSPLRTSEVSLTGFCARVDSLPYRGWIFTVDGLPGNLLQLDCNSCRNSELRGRSFGRSKHTHVSASDLLE